MGKELQRENDMIRTLHRSLLKGRKMKKRRGKPNIKVYPRKLFSKTTLIVKLDFHNNFFSGKRFKTNIRGNAS